MAVKKLQDAIRAKSTPERGTAYKVGAELIPAPELPEQAGALPEAMQTIARNYLAARRRSGEALLDAARWLAEARATAQHGEWLIFLEATSTSTSTADRLLNIHDEAARSPLFAEKVASNWLTFSAAAEIAAQSTPENVKQELLQQETAPTHKEVQHARRAAKFPNLGNIEHGVQERSDTDDAPEPPPTQMRGFAPPAEPPAHEVWRDALLQLRGAKAQARAVQLQAKHFVGQQRRTLLEEIESLQRGLEAAKEALKA